MPLSDSRRRPADDVGRELVKPFMQGLLVLVGIEGEAGLGRYGR